MRRKLSPFSLRHQDFSQSLICEVTGIEVPRRFIDEYFEVPPLWLVTIGYPQHGKSVYLAALTLTLENIGSVWPGTRHTYLDDSTHERVLKMRQDAIDGVPPPPTQVQETRPLLMRVEDIPTAGSYCAVMYDIAGETFLAKENINQIANQLREIKTLWFFVSLNDLERDRIHTLPDLFTVYSETMFDMGVSLRGRTLIVVYTKSDLYEFTTDIDNYIYSDPLRNLTSQAVFNDLPSEFDIHEYVNEMEIISQKLERFTMRLNGGAAFINNATRGEGMTLKFCATSALGQNPTDGRLLIEAERYRVLDPFIWAVWLHQEEEDSEEKYALILDDHPESTLIFEEKLPQIVWETLAEKRAVVTYAFGSQREIAGLYQNPPVYPNTQAKSAIVGPILENLDLENTRVVIITSGAIFDLGDFSRSDCRDSIRVVSTYDGDLGWPHVFNYRNPDDLPALTHYLRNW